MKKFETPEIEVINFAVEDVITVSGGCGEDGALCGNELPAF